MIDATEEAKAFHEHVTKCETCWGSPWAMCEAGKLLQERAAAVAQPAPAEEAPAEGVWIGPEDRHTFSRALHSVLGSRTKAVGAVDGSILRALLGVLEGTRDSK